MHAKLLQSCPALFNPSCQGPLSMGFSRQEYWSGLPFPPPGDLLDPGIKPAPLMSPAWAGRFFATSTTWEAPKGVQEWFLCQKQPEVHPRVIYFSSAEQLHPVSFSPLDSLFCGSGENRAHVPCRHPSLRMLKSKGKKELGVMARANALWFQDGSQASALITGFSVHLGYLSDLQAGVEPVHPDGDALCCHPESHDIPFGCVSSSYWKISFLSLCLGLSEWQLSHTLHSSCFKSW